MCVHAFTLRCKEFLKHKQFHLQNSLSLLCLKTYFSYSGLYVMNIGLKAGLIRRALSQNNARYSGILQHAV